MARGMSRRGFMGTVGAGGLAASMGGLTPLGAKVLAHGEPGGTVLSTDSAPETAAPAPGGEPLRGALGVAIGQSGEYLLPALPYAYDALEPYLSKDLLTVHHDRHHAGYVRGLNADLAKLAEARQSGDWSAVKALSRSLAFNGSGHVLHSLYWTNMSPKGGGEPAGPLGAGIARDFGSYAAFKGQFAAATKAVEASGWGLLVWEPMGRRLLVLQAEKHQDLTVWGCVPLLVCDVWEHAYYLDYKNDRGTFVDRFFDVVNWAEAGARLTAAMGG